MTLSPNAEHWMKFLGDFGPTVNTADELMKGYMYDGESCSKRYLDSNDFLDLASACIEVSKYLRERADK